MVSKPRSVFVVVLLIFALVAVISTVNPYGVLPEVHAALAITLNPTHAGKGAVILVSGTGGSSTVGTTCSITANAASIVVNPTASVSGSTGNVVGSFTVGTAPGAAGAYTITVTCPSSGTPVDSASSSFTIDPSVSLSPSVGTLGQIISVSGFGFQATASSCTIDDTTTPGNIGSPSCSILSPGSGQVSGHFTIASSIASTDTITVTQIPAFGTPATATLQIVTGPTITLSPNGGAGQIVPPSFSPIKVSGAGYSSGVSRSCTITSSPSTAIATSPAPTCTISSTGSVTGTFAVSSSATGTPSISVIDTNPAGVTATATLTIAPQPVITLTTSTGPAGTSSGAISSPTPFSQLDAGPCTIASSPSGLFAGQTCFIDNTGNLLSTSFVVSSSAAGQLFLVTIAPQFKDTSSAKPFTVTAAVTLSISTGSPLVSGSPGAPATEVTVSGTGFNPADSGCTISAPAPPGLIVDTSGEPVCTVSNGVLTGHFRVGAGSTAISAVAVTVKGTPTLDAAPTAPFSVVPNVVMTPASGGNGTLVNLAGSGFASTDTGCTITGSPSNPFSGTAPCGIAGTTGQMSGSFTVIGAPGTYLLNIQGTPTSDSKTVSFVLGTPSATIILNPNPAGIGQPVSVTGSGFNPGDTTCTITGSAVETTTPAPVCSISGGNVVGSFTVKAAAPMGLSGVTVKGLSGGDFATVFLSVPIVSTTTGITSTSTTTTSSTSFFTSITSSGISTSFSTTTVSTSGRSTETNLFFSYISFTGEATTYSTVTALATSTVNSTVTLFTTITVYTTTMTTVTGFIQRNLSDGYSTLLGILGMLILLAPVLLRRIAA